VSSDTSITEFCDKKRVVRTDGKKISPNIASPATKLIALLFIQ